MQLGIANFSIPLSQIGHFLEHGKCLSNTIGKVDAIQKQSLHIKKYFPEKE